MTIRPLEMNGVIQRTQDIGTLKQQEDTKPLVDQQNIQGTVVREEKRLASQVTETEQKEQREFRYDAKEKGGSEYQGEQKKRKKKEAVSEDGKVIRKGSTAGFDMKI